MSASVNLPLHHNVQKFTSGTGSPGWSRKRAVNSCGGDKSTVLSVLLACLLLVPFYGDYAGQTVLAGPAAKNWRILLQQSFTVYMPLLKAASAFGLGRRC